jgi:hypothetical protein
MKKNRDVSLLLRERMISPELVERMKDWRHSGFHAFAGEVPDISDALRVGRYMVRGPATTSRLRPNPAQEPKVRYLARGAVPDHGEETVSSGYWDYDYLEWPLPPSLAPAPRAIHDRRKRPWAVSGVGDIGQVGSTTETRRPDRFPGPPDHP